MTHQEDPENLKKNVFLHLNDLSQYKKISLIEFKLNHIHENCILYATIITEPNIMSAYTVVIEDEFGDAARLSLYAHN